MKNILYVIYQPYKWLFFLPFTFINTLIFGVLAVLFSWLINQKIGSHIGGAIWSRVNAYFTPMFVKTFGKNNIKKNTSYIVVSNHQSYYDIFLIYGWLGIDIKWIMKKELKKIPGLGFGSEKVGHIFLDRSNSKKALESINEAKRKLINGTSLVIFPEGTRSKNGDLGKFKRGAFKLALDLELPILPITVIGTNKILPTDSFNLLPGKAKLIVHEPVDVKYYSENNMNELMETIKTTIEKPLIEKEKYACI